MKSEAAGPVAILFTDMVQSTDLLSRLGDERAKAVFQQHQVALEKAVGNHGGEIVKWEGDGVMAAFTSVADAVRCSVAIQESAVKPVAGESLRVRVGLNVGEVAGWDADDFFGIPVVIASRLCDHAKPGQILCTDVVSGLLAGRRTFRFQQIGRRRLKGVEEPVAVLQVEYDSPDPVHEWTERESEVYRQVAAVAVPARAEQIAHLLMLIPFGQDEEFRVVELGSGEGALAFAILDYYPRARVLALDGSESMRQHAASRLARYGKRVKVEAFALRSDDWLSRLDNADCVVSSLTIHHLSDARKRRLYDSICGRLSKRGGLFIADIAEPQRPEQNQLFAQQYDRLAREQSLALTGSEDAFEKFRDEKWNIFRFGSLPQDEHLSPLSDHLAWLRSTGLEITDCFWLRGGFAIFGGYKSRATGEAIDQSLEEALRSAETALSVVEPGRPMR